ncbi:MAG: peptidase, partial [bacterium]|nr:peptidase [bacterium]
FINAYPSHAHLFSGNHLRLLPSGEIEFSDDFPEAFKRRISVTTCMMINAGQKPFDEKDILANRALFQDYTNQYLVKRGLDLPQFSPEKAAEVLAKASGEWDFILYEFFQTDLYAHRHSFEERVELLKGLNRLLGKLFSLLDPVVDTLLLTSDHGNMEDSSHRSHTRNPVPLITWGRQADVLRNSIDSLTDVTPAIVKFFDD